MSFETTLARVAEQHSKTEWSEHRANCPACSAAARSRAKDGCPQGKELQAVLREDSAALKESRKLDTLPAPGQETLF